MAPVREKLQQSRFVEARQHDAEAPLQGHLVEHLRRRWNSTMEPAESSADTEAR